MIKTLFKKQFSRKDINLTFVLAAFSLAIYLSWSLELAVTLALIIYLGLSDFGARFYRNIAVISAIISAIALVMSEQSISEKIGIVSFAALIIYLTIQLIEVRNNGN